MLLGIKSLEPETTKCSALTMYMVSEKRKQKKPDMIPYFTMKFYDYEESSSFPKKFLCLRSI